MSKTCGRVHATEPPLIAKAQATPVVPLPMNGLAPSRLQSRRAFRQAPPGTARVSFRQASSATRRLPETPSSAGEIRFHHHSTHKVSTNAVGLKFILPGRAPTITCCNNNLCRHQSTASGITAPITARLQVVEHCPFRSVSLLLRATCAAMPRTQAIRHRINVCAVLEYRRPPSLLPFFHLLLPAIGACLASKCPSL